MGKTRLIEEVADVAETRDTCVLWSQMIEEQVVPPYFSWKLALRSCLHQFEDSGVLDELGPAVEDIADIVPELQGDARRRARPKRAADPANRYQLFDAVARLLQIAARKRPLVLLFDNLHAIDRSSIALLEYICRQITGYPVLIIAAYRDSELDRQHPLRTAVGNLARGPGFLRLSLEGLSRDEVARLLHQHIARPPPASLVDAVHRQSGGNPLFVTEVGRMLARSASGDRLTGTGLHFDVPDSLRNVIIARLDILPDRTCSALRTAAVLGREFEIDDLAGLERSQVERTGHALAPAESAGIVEAVAPGRLRFLHVLFREVLYKEHSTIERVLIHRKAAEQIELRHAGHLEPHVGKLAHHYYEAAQAGAVDKAIDYCRRASEAAAAQRAYAEAVSMLERALQLSELAGDLDPQQRFDLLSSMGRQQYAAGFLTPATRSMIKAAVVAFHNQWWKRLADALFSFQLICQQSGYRHISSVPLHKAVLENIADDEVAVRARTLVSLAKAYRTSGEPENARDAFDNGVTLARQAGDPDVLLDALRKGSWVIGRDPGSIRAGLAIAEEVCVLARECGSTEAELDGVVDRVFQLCELGDISEVRKQLQVLRRLVETERQPHFRNILVGFETSLAILEGRWADATRMAQDGVRQTSLQNVIGLEGRFAFQMFAISKAQGLLGRVRVLADQIIAASREEQLWQPGRVLLHCELGQLQKAREVLDNMGGMESLPRDDLRPIAMAYLADACARLQDIERCETLYAMLGPYQGKNITLPGTLMLGSADAFLATLASMTERVDEARMHFEAALQMNAAMGATPALAVTRVNFARFLLRAATGGEHGRARGLMVEARADASRFALQPVLDALVEIGGGADIQGLTKREVDVLREVATGASNGHIADSLSISHNTVATHVRHILRKLDVRNRTEAADLARRAGLLD